MSRLDTRPNFRKSGQAISGHVFGQLFEDSAPAALTIVAAGIPPLIVLNYGPARTRSNEPT